MTTQAQSLKQFIECDIVNLDEDTVEEFLSHYPVEQVIQCLFEELKSLQYGDDAWRLGGAFADVYHKYPIERHIYIWLQKLTLQENKIFLIFLAGYYYYAPPRIKFLIQIADYFVEKIINLSDLNWAEEATILAIEVVLCGYHYINDIIRENEEIKERVQQQVNVFQTYVSNANPNSSDREMIERMLTKWDLGIS